MRRYVPATLDLLRQWADAASVPTTAAVTAPDEQEESEYAALLDAADASAALLAAPGRRVVVVVEGPESSAQVPFTDVVAVHADTEDVDPTGTDPPELAWFATQEVPDLLRRP